MSTAVLRHPSRAWTAGDSPCPSCGRYGGHPDITHGGEAPDGSPDVSLAGLRCTAEVLAAALDPAHLFAEGTGGDTDRLADLLSEAEAYADFLARALAVLDRRAGGVD